MWYAGALTNTANSTYYLYNNENYWTMTPSNYSGTEYKPMSYVFVITTNGGVWSTGVSPNTATTYHSLRPVLNLRSDVSFQSGGLGTGNKPYVVAN